MKKPRAADAAPSRQDLIRAAIEKCAHPKTGRVDPDRVWQAARDPKSPLHSEFEWDLQKAAIEHWRDTAQKLIRSVKLEIVHENRRHVVPLYMADPTVDYSAYIPTLRIASRESAMRDALEMEIGQIEGLIKRILAVSHAFDVVDEVEQLLEDLLRLRRKLKSNQNQNAEAASPSVAPA